MLHKVVVNNPEGYHAIQGQLLYVKRELTRYPRIGQAY